MKQLTVYYDEMCVLCAKEIHHYQKQSGSEKINFIDITAPDFDPQKEGVDPFAVHKIMHAKKSDGTLVTKIEAFIAIWQLLPKYNWLYKVSQNFLVRKLMDSGYVAFAVARPYLPKKKNRDDCSKSPYCETHIVTKNK
jgi:predicted DCC family thiol-disulfide oxidoreductase YuxK